MQEILQGTNLGSPDPNRWRLEDFFLRVVGSTNPSFRKESGTRIGPTQSPAAECQVWWIVGASNPVWPERSVKSDDGGEIIQSDYLPADKLKTNDESPKCQTEHALSVRFVHIKLAEVQGEQRDAQPSARHLMTHHETMLESPDQKLERPVFRQRIFGLAMLWCPIPSGFCHKGKSMSRPLVDPGFEPSGRQFHLRNYLESDELTFVGSMKNGRICQGQRLNAAFEMCPFFPRLAL